MLRFNFNFVGDMESGGYDSSFDEDTNPAKRRRKEEVSLSKPEKTVQRIVSNADLRRMDPSAQISLPALNAYSRHKEIINNYFLYYSGSMKNLTPNVNNDKRDMDVVREHHQFVWEEGKNVKNLSWEKRLAKKYYEKLFKEYCIADLTRFKENKIGLRWRIESEVVDGKGQFYCGDKRCKESESLRSWEVNFAYVECKEKKNALVKLRLCPDCSKKLNYHQKKKEIIPKHLRQKSNKKEDSVAEETNAEPAESTSKDEIQNEGVSTANPWTQTTKVETEPNRDEEFDAYFQELFL